jgi:hypothetical protein
MAKERLPVLFTLALLLLALCRLGEGRRHSPRRLHKHPQEEDNSSDNMNFVVDGILEGDRHKATFIVSYMGDQYLTVNEGKLVPTSNYKTATYFTVALKGEHERDGFRLEAYMGEKKHPVSYPTVGNNILLGSFPNKKRFVQDKTFFPEVVVHNAKHQFFQITSFLRQMCITLEPAAKIYILKKCSKGESLQIFQFRSYDEARKLASTNQEGRFSMKDYLQPGTPKGRAVLAGNYSGKLFN